MAKKKRGGSPMDRSQRVVRNLDKVRSWLGFYYAAAILVLFTLIFSSYTYFDITGDKFSCYRVSTLVVLSLLVVALGQAVINGWRPSLSVRGIWASSSITQKLLVLLALLWILSTIFSPLEVGEEVQAILTGNAWLGESNRFNGLQSHLLYCLTPFLIIWCGFKHRDWLLFAFGGTMVVFSLIGILQGWGYNPLTMYHLDENRAVYVNFYTTVGNSNFVSGMLCLGIPACGAAFVLMEGKGRWFFLPTLFISTYFLFLIQVDSGLVGLGVFLLLFPLICCNTPRRLGDAFIVFGVIAAAAFVWQLAVPTGGPNGALAVDAGFGKGDLLCLAVALVCFALAGLIHWRGAKLAWSKRAMTRAMAILLAVVILAAALVFVLVPLPSSTGFLYQAQEMLVRGNWDDHFGSNRLFIWKRVPALILENPLLGTGANSFKGAFQENYLEEVKAFSDYASGYTVYDSAHNMYLDYAVECGLLGLACYLAMLITLLVRALRHREDDPFLLIFVCVLLVYFSQGMFSFTNIVIAPVAWLMIGLLERSVRQCEKAAILS